MPPSPTSDVRLLTRYTPKDGDLLLLPYADAQTPLFPEALLPEGLGPFAAPEEAGGARTVFRGPLGRAEILVRAVRLDREDCPCEEQARQKVAAALKRAREEGAGRVVLLLAAEEEALRAAAHEGALLGGYAFDRYLQKRKKPLPVALVSDLRRTAAVRRGLEATETVCAAVNFARDVLNEPANVIHPPSLARAFQAEGKAAGLTVSVWDEKRLARERCGGILAVGRGARARPRLVQATYRPRGARLHLALVGKGVTFDTGGYCLKPAGSQMGMKYDMGGAAMMFGAACAIARLGLKIRLTVLTPLAENDISADAYHVQDILTTRSGRTVQVDNTDAEGRLLLADALTLAQEKKPDLLVDAATLTGACVVALGEDIAAAYGTDRARVDALVEAGAGAGELFWPMPLHRPYARQLETAIADGKNIGGKWGGSITAALFLRQWIADGQDWIHLDIAGPGCKEEPLGPLGKGAKGFGVRALVAFARRLAG